MSLKIRISAAVVAILIVVTGVLGWAVVTVNRATAVGAIDERLDAVVSTGVLRGLQPPQEGRGPGRGAGEVTTISYVWNPRTDSWVSLVPNVDQLLTSPPVLPIPGTEGFDALAASAGTVPSVDGSTRYRMRTTVDQFGRAWAVATSLAEVDRTGRALVRTVVALGLLAVGVGAAACWWVIGRALRPVDRMVETAQAIAAGDRSSRVEHSDDGTEIGRLGAALDEMLARLEADALERERANERLARFVADASHELRTPVAAVRGYAELFLSGGVPDGEASRTAMRRIESESVRMGTLIDELLLLTRLDREPEAVRDRVDLRAVVDDAVSAFAVVHPDRPISVDPTAGDGSAVVLGDADRLRQVLDNLLVNAATHTPPGTPVVVGLDVGEGAVRLTVADEGPGVPEGRRDEVFERFTRLDDSRARTTGGSGLGLSIVRAIVETHGGTVVVDPTTTIGARFVVTLPAAPVQG
jgi:two-component system OmpR family sensor kinase